MTVAARACACEDRGAGMRNAEAVAPQRLRRISQAKELSQKLYPPGEAATEIERIPGGGATAPLKTKGLHSE